MKFSFSGNNKFTVKIGSCSRNYPLSAIECFLSSDKDEEEHQRR